MTRDRAATDSPAVTTAGGSPSWRPYAALAAMSSGVLVLVLAAVATAGAHFSSFNDFRKEAWPAYRYLLDGHLLAFIQHGPAYEGSLILRAPFALIPLIWGGGWRAVYVATAVPCLIVVPSLVAWLLYERRNASPTPSTAGAMLVGTFTPPLLIAVLEGHPEDALGAALCVAGVLAATRNRPGWCAGLLTLAVINKSWALVALPVALVALPAARVRVAAIVAVLGGGALAAIAELQHAATGAGVASVTGAGTGGTLFSPVQLLWWLGSGSAIAAHARLILVLVAFACGLLWWLRRRRAGVARTPARADDALTVLAFVLLLRAALDPQDNLYYHLPFVLALLACELHTRRWPLLASLYSLLLAVGAPVAGLGLLGMIIPVHALVHPSPNLQAAVYAAVVVPMLAHLASIGLLGNAPRIAADRRRRRRRRVAGVWHPDRSPYTPQRP